MTKDTLAEWGVRAFVVLAAVSLPGGLVLQYLYPESSWWMISAGALILFMAG